MREKRREKRREKMGGRSKERRWEVTGEKGSGLGLK